MSYMTSRTPLETDSWTYRDNYFKNPGDYGMSDSNNHTHLVKFQGKYYLFYHSLGLQDSRDLKVGVRSICVEEIEVDEKDLTIHMGTATAKGVSQIKPLDPFAQQQAETTAATRGVAFEQHVCRRKQERSGHLCPRCGIPAITSSHTDEDKRERLHRNTHGQSRRSAPIHLDL